MNRCLQSLGVASLSAMLCLGGCGKAMPGNQDGFIDDDPDMAQQQGTFIRVHYRLQGAGDVKSWGAHFWGAGTTSPTWGQPQRFDKTDEFGGYTDIKVTDTADTAGAWLGLIPVQCSGSNCRKDVETSVRFVDLYRDPMRPHIAECWITQGQAVKAQRPTSTGTPYKINRPGDFIDLGDGRVRLMFRVAPGSTGTVRYGAAAGTLDRQVSWAANEDINKQGLLLTGLTPGAKVYYKISTALADQKDESAVLELTPIRFSTVAQAADWASWGQKGVMYQLIVRTFADGGTPKAVTDSNTESGIDPATRDGVGDLVGLRNTLPYLKDLGIDAIWMTPVFKAKSYHGYDTTDFYDVDPSAGTKKDFAELAKAAHALGIRIILDLVQNHVADVNPWFVAAADPRHPDHAKYRDWFVWSDDYSNMFTDEHPWDPSAVIWACKNYACYHAIFGASMPELNYRNPAVRAEMKKIAAFWIAQGADGYRLDASKHIDQFDDNHSIALSQHGTHLWWKEFNYYVKKDVTRPAGSATVILAGENRWDDPKAATKMVPYAGDMDSQFDFPFRTVLAGFLAGKTGTEGDFVKYVKDIGAVSAMVGSGGNANHYYERFLSNHDLDRPATQFQASPEALLKQAATVVFTLPGMPVVYYGEEFGKKGKRDKFLGTEGWDHDEFIREPMSWFNKIVLKGDKMKAWDIDFAATNMDRDNAALMLGAGVCKAANPDYPFIKFMTETDPQSWAAQKGKPDSLLTYYKKLIAIRKANSVLTDLDATLDVAQQSADLYEYTLTKGGQTLSVVLNRKASNQTVMRAKAQQDLLTGASKQVFDVPAYGALILK
jgi:glycosidase